MSCDGNEAVLADDHDLVVAQTSEASDNRPVVGKKPVAMQLGKAGKGRRQIIEGEGPLRVPGQLHALPGCEISENLAARFLDFVFDLLNLRLDADAERVHLRMLLQLSQFVLQFNDRLFKVELMSHPWRD